MRALCVLLTVFSLTTSIARAENPAENADAGSDRAAARQLFIEARQLAAAGKYSLACPKFEEGQRLQPGIGALLNLADCWEHLGRTASAWARYLDVAALAARAGQDDREQIASERAAALEPQLARLTLHVAPQPELHLTRDNVEIREALWESAAPVDPGQHVIEATAPGKVAWRKVVGVNPREHVELDVPLLATSEPPVLSPETPAEPAHKLRARAVRPSRSTEPSPPSHRPLEQTVGYALGAAGIVAVSIGTWAALAYESSNAEARSLCAQNVCQSSSELGHHSELVRSATHERDLALAAFAVGTGALAGGTLLVLTARRGEPRRLALRMRIGSLALAGTW